MKHSKLRIFENIIGILAVVIFIALFFVARNYTDIFKVKPDDTSLQEQNRGFYEIDGDLVYDGTGTLDLMQGVYADDGNGNDVTENVSAIITADGTLSKKVVRYTFFDAAGKSVTEKRTLVMKNYKGPSITVPSNITLEATDLSDLINVLHARDELETNDGFGKDIYSKVTCLREHVSQNKYKLTFNLNNDFLDSKSISVSATINGDVLNPIIDLSSNVAMITVGEEFSPMNLVAGVSNGPVGGKNAVEVESHVDTSVPGTYSVIYRLYSPDRTALTTEVLKVTVTGA